MQPDVPRLRHPDDIRLRWIVAKWDGLISGVAEMDGRLVWFQVIDVEETARRYEVFDLTDDEMADHVARHESVVLFAGTFDDCSWDSEAGVYRHGELRRGVDWSSYVDPFPTPENQAYEGRKPVGWFVEQHIQLGPASP